MGEANSVLGSPPAKSKRKIDWNQKGSSYVYYNYRSTRSYDSPEPSSGDVVRSDPDHMNLWSLNLL